MNSKKSPSILLWKGATLEVYLIRRNTCTQLHSRYRALRKIIIDPRSVKGATNDILWKIENSLTLDEALAEARKLGYAEENSDYDIEGLDTACNLTTLGNSVMNPKFHLENFDIRGNKGLTPVHLSRAKVGGSAIRLVGTLSRSGMTEVHPRETPRVDPLCINSVYNAVKVDTKCSTYTLIDRGSSGQATAYLLLRDPVAVAEKRLKTAHAGQNSQVPLAGVLR